MNVCMCVCMCVHVWCTCVCVSGWYVCACMCVYVCTCVMGGKRSGFIWFACVPVSTISPVLICCLWSSQHCRMGTEHRWKPALAPSLLDFLGEKMLSPRGHREGENCSEVSPLHLFTHCLLLESSRNPEQRWFSLILSPSVAPSQLGSTGSHSSEIDSSWGADPSLSNPLVLIGLGGGIQLGPQDLC